MYVSFFDHTTQIQGNFPDQPQSLRVVTGTWLPDQTRFRIWHVAYLDLLWPYASSMLPSQRRTWVPVLASTISTESGTPEPATMDDR